MPTLADETISEGAPRLTPAEQKQLLAQVPEWSIENERLVRTWRLPDFAKGLDLVNRIGRAAEQLNHHPDVHLAWGRVRVEIWTHSAGGLTKNDFVLASRLDRL